MARTRLPSCAAALALLFIASSADGQIRPAAPVPGAPRDAGPPQLAQTVGTAVIPGTVVIAGSGQPARKARVSLSGQELRGGRTVTTDDHGRFSFSAIPAGRFTLSASKPGHISVTYGQRRPGSGRPGTPIQIADGQKMAVTLQMPRGGVISGTVLDESGEPTPGTQVRVLRYTMQSGQRTLQQGGSGSTDDRGVYRIYGLQPGDYLVCATPRNNNPQMQELERMQAEIAALRQNAGAAGPQAAMVMERLAALQGQMPSGDEPVAGYAPVYYPGTATASGAASLTLGIGEEKLGVDFQLQVVAVARIEGTVISPSGVEPQNVQVMLINTGDDVAGIGNNSARPGRDGRFTLSNVPPGQYTLTARANVGRPMVEAPQGAPQAGAPRGQEQTRLWAAQDLAVDGRAVTNVVLTLQNGLSISGRIEFQGTTQQPADLSRTRVNLTPVVSTPAVRELAMPAPGRVDASGRFTINSVSPGRYRLSASVPGGWFVDSAVVGGQDTLDFPLDIKGTQNITGATITFTDQQSELSGTVANDRGQPVIDYSIVIYPTDQRYWGAESRRIRTVRPATDGTFKLTHLPPGEYRIAPVFDPEPGAWFDASFLQQLDTASERFSIMNGEKKVQNVRVAGGGF
jgi:Carboxypeptidase regulatory-like domain